MNSNVDRQPIMNIATGKLAHCGSAPMVQAFPTTRNYLRCKYCGAVTQTPEGYEA